MRLGSVLLVVACCAAFAPPVSADVRVTFANGRVTVIADNATVSEILAEWARVGGSTFVDADKIPARDRLTLRLEDQAELDAIDVLLRSVAGYMVAPAPAGSASASTVARVFILPTSTPVAYVAPAPEGQTEPTDADAPARLTSAPPRPDDDGPVRVQTPPAVTAPAPTATAPMGQASPLISGAPSATQTVPGLGVVTSTQPGVAIGTSPPAPRSQGGRPVLLRPSRPGGGGGARR
ncbi:MAG: hypothetical protein M3Q55_10065 [Acidobacteriota bacterium]|nr:hypothetical protein [Acidobacteriota bacterium]